MSALRWFALVALLPSVALGWKPSTHVALSEMSLADVLDDGQVAIHRVDYVLGQVETQCKNPKKLGTYAADPELVAAVNAWPSHYRAGVIGPDAYPDIMTGQQIIHTDAKRWYVHLWSRAKGFEGDPQTRAKILAFAAGYLTHAAGDMYMHTFVNHFAGGPFELGWNAARHLKVEGYTAKLGPQPSSWDTSISGIEGWLKSTFVYDAADPKGDTRDLLHLGAFELSIPSRLGDIRLYLQEKYIDWYAAEKPKYTAGADGAEGLDWVVAEGARLLFISEWGPAVTYTEAWVTDIDTCLDQWVTFSHELARLLAFHPSGIQLDAASDVASRFVADYLLSALGLPDAAGGVLGIGLDVLGLADKVLAMFKIDWISQLKEDALNYMLLTTTGHNKEQWKSYASETLGEAAFDEVFIQGPQGAGPNPSAVSFRHNYLHIQEEADRPWDWARLRHAYNTVTVVKLIFLTPQSLQEVALDLGYDVGQLSGENASNIMIGFLTSLDDDNRWWEDDPPRMLLAQEFCRYKKIFMKQTGENKDWQTACGADAPPVNPPVDPPEEPETPPCEHSRCQTGSALTPACDPCVEKVCAIDPFCCEHVWDAACLVQFGVACSDQTCPPACGNGVLDAGETCEGCPADCDAATAGNGLCEPGECLGAAAADCPGGCPACGHDLCQTGEAATSDCDPCAASVCAEDPFCCDNNWDDLCVALVSTVCAAPCAPVCGDYICSAGEGCAGCERDCGACVGACGDGTCDWFESCSGCPGDCGECVAPAVPLAPGCGNGDCGAGESCASCPADCGACDIVCGDLVCDEGEDCKACLYDGEPGSCACPNNFKFCESLEKCVFNYLCPAGAIYYGGCECCLQPYFGFPEACLYCAPKDNVYYDYCPL